MDRQGAGYSYPERCVHSFVVKLVLHWSASLIRGTLKSSRLEPVTTFSSPILHGCRLFVALKQQRYTFQLGVPCAPGGGYKDCWKVMCMLTAFRIFMHLVSPTVPSNISLPQDLSILVLLAPPINIPTSEIRVGANHNAVGNCPKRRNNPKRYAALLCNIASPDHRHQYGSKNV